MGRGGGEDWYDREDCQSDLTGSASLQLEGSLLVLHSDGV